MNPAFSVIFLTTLIGVGQGLFLALVTGQIYQFIFFAERYDAIFYSSGSIIALGFLVAGLAASFFHLGRPERAWRTAAQWRTSWLSREVIALPVVMVLLFAYGLLHHLDWAGEWELSHVDVRLPQTLLVGVVGIIVTLVLFICTGMIYACLKFLQEWASPLTVINYTLLGSASGFTLATVLASQLAFDLILFHGIWAIIITATALLTRAASLLRNARLKATSTMQTAIGIRHTKIQQKAMGFMGGSVNTRDFFHQKTVIFLRNIRWIFLLLVFAAPIVLLMLGLILVSEPLFLAAFLSQYIGLIAERWFFFAQANHPQNLYYQTV